WDPYPVGGYTSISTKGSIESLLHSQLAYMEPDDGPGDLFDMKLARDELFYYARDENQFLRRRRAFVFALAPDLVNARFKDAELPYQRVVMLSALLLVVVRKLSEWLSTDALNFHFLFVGEGDADPLKDERALLETLLREQVALQTAHFGRATWKRVAELCTGWARRSMVHCLSVGVQPPAPDPDDTVVNRLAVNGPRPALGDGQAEP